MVKVINEKTEKHEIVPVEVLAQSIERLSNAADAMRTSKLKPKTIIVLLHHMTKMPMRDIEIILNALPLLAKEYLKP